MTRSAVSLRTIATPLAPARRRHRSRARRRWPTPARPPPSRPRSTPARARSFRYPLYVGYDRPLEGRHPEQQASIAAARDTVAFDKLTIATRSSPICRSPGSAIIPQLRAGLRRGLLHGLPGERRDGGGGSARDRPDLPFRAAARLRADAHPHHDPHGGCGRAEARHVPPLSRRRQEMGREDPEPREGPLLARLHYALGDLLVYEPLKNVLGFSRIRVAYTAGEAIGADLFSFYRSLGLNLKQLYGQTEAFLYVTAKPTERSAPTPSARRCRMSRSALARRRGAVQIAGQVRRLLQGRREDRRSLDAGRLREDRRRRLLRPRRAIEDHRSRQGCRPARGRALFAPKYIENKLKFFPNIKEAVAFGDGPRLRHRDDQHRAHLGRQLGRAQQCPLCLLPGARRPQRVYDMIERACRRREPRARRGTHHGRRADQALSHPAQGTRRRRRRVDAHPKSAPRRHRRALCAADQGLYGGETAATSTAEVTFEDGRKGRLAAYRRDM